MVRADGTAPPVSVWKSVSYHHSAGENAEPRSRTAVIQSGEQAEPSKKKVPRKKQLNTGVWPCKINGCNKQFAREADLKRHQRTTKLHSMPGLFVTRLLSGIQNFDALIMQSVPAVRCQFHESNVDTIHPVGGMCLWMLFV